MLEKTSEVEIVSETIPLAPSASVTSSSQKWLKLKTLQTFWQTNLPPIILWLRWRLAFLILPLFAFSAFPNNFDNAVGRYPLPGAGIWLDRLVGSWARWDSWWYTLIAQHGYQSELAASYYPAYPLLMRGLTFIFTFDNTWVSLTIVGIFISSLACLAACILLYQLAQLDYDLKTSRLTILYLTAFPSAFFLFAVYTEALFLALAVGAFLAARKNHWLLAMLLAAIAILTKNQGVFLVIALLVQYGQQSGWRISRKNWSMLYFLLPIATYGGWLAFNAATFGNFITFLSSTQKFWHRQFVWPWEVLGSAFDITFQKQCADSCASFSEKPYLLEFLTVLGFLILAAIGVWAVRQSKLQLSYLIFFVGCLLQPLSFPQSDEPLGSMLRYLLMLFPAFMLMAQFGRRWPFFHYVYLSVSLPLLILMAARFNLWFWVS